MQNSELCVAISIIFDIARENLYSLKLDRIGYVDSVLSTLESDIKDLVNQ